MIEQLRKLIAPLHRRIMLSIARGVVKVVDDSKGLQKVQITLLADEVADKLERVQQYGFTSKPKAGAEAVALFLGGNRDHGVVIAVDDRRYRLKGLADGEVALYTDTDSKIVLKNGGKIEVWNGQYELMAVLSDVMDHLIAARTATMNGPQPLLGSEFPDDKAKIDSFKA